MYMTAYMMTMDVRIIAPKRRYIGGILLDPPCCCSSRSDGWFDSIFISDLPRNRFAGLHLNEATQDFE
jgi:hypothetical protein